jgi:hypothetical protein
LRLVIILTTTTVEHSLLDRGPEIYREG